MNEKVGEGTYGCVFKPSLKCKEKINTYETFFRIYLFAISCELRIQ